MIIAVYYVNDNEVGKINKLYNTLLNDLGMNGIEVLEQSDTRFIIQTPHVWVQFFTDLHYLVGRRFDGIFGPVEQRDVEGRFKDCYERYGDWGGNLGTLLDYIIEKERGYGR